MSRANLREAPLYTEQVFSVVKIVHDDWLRTSARGKEEATRAVNAALQIQQTSTPPVFLTDGTAVSSLVVDELRANFAAHLRALGGIFKELIALYSKLRLKVGTLAELRDAALSQCLSTVELNIQHTTNGLVRSVLWADEVLAMHTKDLALKKTVLDALRDPELLSRPELTVLVMSWTLSPHVSATRVAALLQAARSAFDQPPPSRTACLSSVPN
eukprot:gnl/Spiro4/9628_TR5105_c0_g1_i1.p1 gnl/Spiro4/9628_TR5105_c0_g1~~gnl/Spiro4/9628_TR5105_c0_g1_i1.p1  ORF type:complete len:215 (+),score=39.70 gnl/Spiro4/9628_TR5105_c0_g1_i1:59-703(+)